MSWLTKQKLKTVEMRLSMRVTKSAVDEGFCDTCGVQLLLVLEYCLGVDFQLHLYTHRYGQTCTFTQ